jgi:hypothetical protein
MDLQIPQLIPLRKFKAVALAGIVSFRKVTFEQDLTSINMSLCGKA